MITPFVSHTKLTLFFLLTTPQIIIKLKNLHYLENKIKGEYDIYTTGDLMTFPPETVAVKEKAIYIENLLRRTSHNGFPVVNNRLSNKYLGFVRCSEYIKRRLFVLATID